MSTHRRPKRAQRLSFDLCGKWTPPRKFGSTQKFRRFRAWLPGFLPPALQVGADAGALARGLMHLASLVIPKAARALQPDVCWRLRQALFSEPVTSSPGLTVPSRLPPAPHFCWEPTLLLFPGRPHLVTQKC